MTALQEYNSYEYMDLTVLISFVCFRNSEHQDLSVDEMKTNMFLRHVIQGLTALDS